MEETNNLENFNELKKQLAEKESEIIMLKEQVSVLEQELSNKDKDIQLLQANLDFAMGKENAAAQFDYNSTQDMLEADAHNEMSAAQFK